MKFNNEYYNDLYIEVEDKSLRKEWDSIKREDKGYKAQYNTNKIVNKFQSKEIFKEEIELWNRNEDYKGLPLRSYLYNNRKKYINKGFGEVSRNELLIGFRKAGICLGKSYHSPFYIKEFINEFKVTSIYDTCGGWGHRLLGAISRPSVNYIYNDINKNTLNNVKEIYKYINSIDNINNRVSFYNKDASKFTPKEDYEAVFTCPPYFNREIYSEQGAENLSKEDFINWWKGVFNKSTSKETCKYFAYIINNKYKEAFNSVINANKFTMLKEYTLNTNNNYNHFQRKSNSQHSGEILIVWDRNDR